MARSVANAVDTDLYETDFHLWTQRQAELLRRGRFGDLDLENLIEEIEGLGRNDRSAVESHLHNVLWHLLKLQLSPAVPPRHGWKVTVRAQRNRLKRLLSGSLRNHLTAALEDLYGDARGLAALDLEQDSVPPDIFPARCPYTLDQILDPDWFPANVHGTDAEDGEATG